MNKLTTEQIIEQNLELQTTKRQLNKLGVYCPSLGLFKSEKFLNTYKNWNEEKQNQFARLVGGIRYAYKVKGLLNYEKTI